MRTTLILLVLYVAIASAAPVDAGRIKPYTENPCYWQYKGEPVLLLGGSKDDSLFQIPDLKEHLDLLASVGGNTIRNTMSARNDKGFEVQPFQRRADGKYNLEQWNDEYWTRLQNLLKWTHERDIIVQIEVWDRFDHSQQHWDVSPWNPKNNVNYTAAQTGLAHKYPVPAWRDKQPFFHTIPRMKRYKSQYDRVRANQEAFVAKVLSYSLEYGNVLYCMNNEISTPPKWGIHWMRFIREKAAEKGVDAYTTDMFDDGWKPHASAKIKLAIERPETYAFLDISQVNSRSFNEDHWKRLRWVAEQIQSNHPRPLNHTKIYSGGETNWGSGTPKDGVERFWRNLIGGSAMCRFHRPGAGIGLNALAQACVRSARLAETAVKFWTVAPRMDMLRQRETDEAYLAADPGQAYLLYFTDGGSVELDLRNAPGAFVLKWIDIYKGKWAGEREVDGGAWLDVTAPGEEGWVAVVVKKSSFSQQ